jgi:hypothetical protein
MPEIPAQLPSIDLTALDEALAEELDAHHASPSVRRCASRSLSKSAARSS